MTGAQMEPDWRWLPANVLDSILEELVSLYDYASFSAVCARWRAAADGRSRSSLKRLKQVPLLAISSSKLLPWRRLYRVTDDTLFSKPLLVPRKKYWSSSNGWLVFDHSESIVLYNPISGRSISLPSVRDWSKKEEMSVITARLSEEHTALPPGDYYVAAVVRIEGRGSDTVFLIRSRDVHWTEIHLQIGRICDVIFFRDSLYAVTYFGRVLRFKLRAGLSPLLTFFTETPLLFFEETPFGKSYLLESTDGNLIIAIRILAYSEQQKRWVTSKFKVFRLLIDENGHPRPVEVNDLGGDALFLGHNFSGTVPATEFPGCRGDCIYYIDFYKHMLSFIANGVYVPGGRHDVGVFDMNSAKVEVMFSVDVSNGDIPPPFWISPEFYTHKTLTNVEI